MIDLDPNIATVLDRHTPPLDETGDWNHVLADAGVVEPRSGTREKPRRFGSKRARAFVLAVAVALAAGLTSVALLGGGSSILDRASAAISVSPDQVLHERIVLTWTGGGEPSDKMGSIEIWIQGAAPHHYRLFFTAFHVNPRTSLIPAHFEQGGTLDSRSPRVEVYDPRTNTIRRARAGPLKTGTLPFDPAIAIRKSLASGHAHVEGKRTVNGKPVIVIQLDSLVNDSVGWGVRPGGTGTATVLVDPRTYSPVQIAFHHVDGVHPILGAPQFHRGSDWAGTSGTVIERFTTFERLPATTANLRLASLGAQHPTARRVTVGPDSLFRG